MNKKLFFIMSLLAILCIGCNTTSQSSEEDKTEYMVEMEKFANKVLLDPATFDMDFKTEQDSLGLVITESPDGNVRFYTWWDGALGLIVSHDNVYQTRSNDKIRAFDWRNPEKDNYFPNFPLAVRQVESSNGAVYLLFSVCGGGVFQTYSINAFVIDRSGELKPAYVFDFVESLADQKTEEGCCSFVCFDSEGAGSISLYLDKGWSDNFFFDLTDEDVYLPVFDKGPNSKYADLYFNDYYHHFHWNGEVFDYQYLAYNPALEQFVEPSYQLICEFELGKSFIRIEKMIDGTFRYAAWTKEKMFTASPDLVIENGWYHEVERLFHFTNNDYEYVFDASEDRLHIYRTDSKTGKTEEIANYHIDDIYSQIPGAF